MITEILALCAGLLLGVFFALCKLPLPAPSSIAGVFGIAGVTIGYLLVKQYIL
jgi:XapX domain-containing protein